MVDPKRHEPLELAVVLASDKNSVEFLKKMDRWNEISGGWLWGGWYTVPKFAGIILQKASPHTQLVNSHPSVLQGDPPLIRQLNSKPEMVQLGQACQMQIKTGIASQKTSDGSNKRMFAISARMLVIMLLLTQGKLGTYARGWFRMVHPPTLDEMLQQYQAAQAAKTDSTPTVVSLKTTTQAVPTQATTTKPVKTRAVERPPSVAPAPSSFYTIYCDAGVVSREDLRCSVLAAYDPRAGIGIIEYVGRVLPTYQAEMQAIELGHRNFPEARHIRTDSMDAITFWTAYEKVDDEQAARSDMDAVCLYPLRGKGIEIYHVKSEENIVADYLTKYGRDPSKAGRYNVTINGNQITLEPLDPPVQVVHLPTVQVEVMAAKHQAPQSEAVLLTAQPVAQPSLLDMLQTEYDGIQNEIADMDRMQQELESALQKLQEERAIRQEEAAALLPTIEMTRKRERRLLKES